MPNKKQFRPSPLAHTCVITVQWINMVKKTAWQWSFFIIKSPITCRMCEVMLLFWAQVWLKSRNVVSFNISCLFRAHVWIQYVVNISTCGCIYIHTLYVKYMYICMSIYICIYAYNACHTYIGIYTKTGIKWTPFMINNFKIILYQHVSPSRMHHVLINWLIILKVEIPSSP